MTQPPDPNAPLPGATLKETAAAFAEKMLLSSYQDFGATFRPGLANALATGTATPDDINQITGFVRALDVAKQARANSLANVGMEHSAEQQDLLNSTGESASIVKRANATAQNTKDPAATTQWFDTVGRNVATYSANSGDLIFPTPSGFAGKGTTPSGASQNPITHFLKVGLDAVGNFAGWFYRSAKEGAEQNAVNFTHLTSDDATAKKAADKLGLTQLQNAQKALGYNPNNPLSDLAFQWNHGEANFNDLSSVVQTYGQDRVNDALSIFYKMRGYGADRNVAVSSYMQDLEQQVRDGKLTPEQFTARQKSIDSKDFQDVLNAVDMQHVSFGRDFAHLVLPHQAYDDPNNAGMFKFLSGVGDAAFSIAADPTLGAAKVLKAGQIARYGVDALSGTKISRLLGVADKVTGTENKATALGGRVQGFLDSADKVRTLAADGDHVGAAAEHARMSRTYRDLMPMLNDVNGERLAITEADRAAAAKAGTTTTYYGTVEVPSIKTDPITTLDQFRDYLTDVGTLNRVARGVGDGTVRMMPGKVGIIGRTLSKAAGARAAGRVLNHADVVLDYTKDLDKITPSDWSDMFQKIAQARGSDQFDALKGQLGIARRLRAGTEAMNRRITSLLPVAKTISFNANDAGSDIERLARLSLPKYEASILRYIWDTAPNEATNRAIGRGIANAVYEASGLTRSVIGREALDKWNQGFDALTNRRYGLGETDRIQRADGSVGRVAMNLSQLETHLVIPSFEKMRQISAKASILGYDRRIADGEPVTGMSNWFTNAAGEKDVGAGLAHMALHPWRTAKYGLFFSPPIHAAMGIIKMGWLLTSSNMLRQMAEEYMGIGASGNRTKLVNGKRYLRLNNDTNRFLIALHNHIPTWARRNVVTEQDAAEAVTHSRYRIAMGDGPISDPEKVALSEVSEKFTHPQTLEALGARQADQLDGIDVAVEGHREGVQHVRVGWDGKGVQPKRQVIPSMRFKGYTQTELEGDSGRSALSDMYGQLFHDQDEPALRALAWHMWNKAAEDPKFLAKLSERDLAKMHELVPVEYEHGGMPLYRVQEKGGSLAPSKKPHGLYLSHETQDFVSPHASMLEGDTEEIRKEAVYQPGDKAVLSPTPLKIDVKGLRGKESLEVEADAGVSALRSLVDDNQWAELLAEARKGKTSFAKYLRAHFTGGQYDKAAWSKYHDSYEQLMALGGMKARGAGYKAIWHESDDAKFNEYVALTDDAIRDRTPGKIIPPSPQSIIDYVASDPRMGVFRQRAEVLNTDHNGRVIQPGDDATRAEMVDWYVHNQMGNVAAAVYNHAGDSMHVPLVSDLLHSKIPSPEELAKMSLTNLPKHVIRAEFEPAPIGAIGRFGQGITQLFGRAFDHVVTNPMYRLVRKPLFTANYVQARVALAPWEKQLVEEFGWKAEEAKRVVSGMAEGQALQDTIRYIDNPAVRSQFSVIAQNVWLFYRAQEDWARRWMRILKENPEAIRKAHMAIMAGSQTGMIDKDTDGNLIFSYPGSGLALEAMMHVGALFGGGVTVPHVDDLTSQVNFLNPALMNPIGFSATPAVSVPFDLLAKFIPGGESLKASADMAMEGQLGNGRQWWENFMPTAVRRLMQLTPIDGSHDNTASVVGSSAASAIQNAALLGQLPKDSSDAVAAQKFITDTQTQTLNGLIARSIFSFVAPGAPSMPELYGQEPADFSWRSQGIRTLDDEYKAMVQSFGFDKALVMWQELHPDKLIVTVGKTSVSAKGASIDPTQPTTEWIMHHKDLFDGPYRRVAAYLIPPAPGQFDQIGWNTLMAIGVRQHKDLAQYYQDIVQKMAVTDWFNSEDSYNAASAAAKSGDLTQLEKQWDTEHLTDARKAQLRQIFSNTQNAGLTSKAVDDAWTKKKADLHAQYPVLTDYFANTASRKAQTAQMVSELRQMVQDPTVNLPDLPGVAQMLIVKDNYEKQSAQLKSQRSTWATSQRQDLLNGYQDTLKQIVAKYPNLGDLYDGVFRYLEQ